LTFRVPDCVATACHWQEAVQYPSSIAHLKILLASKLCLLSGVISFTAPCPIIGRFTSTCFRSSSFAELSAPSKLTRRRINAILTIHGGAESARGLLGHVLVLRDSYLDNLFFLSRRPCCRPLVSNHRGHILSLCQPRLRTRCRHSGLLLIQIRVPEY